AVAQTGGDNSFPTRGGDRQEILAVRKSIVEGNDSTEVVGHGHVKSAPGYADRPRDVGVEDEVPVGTARNRDRDVRQPDLAGAVGGLDPRRPAGRLGQGLCRGELDGEVRLVGLAEDRSPGGSLVE